MRSEETRDEAFDVLLHKSEQEIERDKGKKRKDASLKSLTQIHSKLAAIDISISGRETYSAMLKQLKEIISLSERLRKDIEAANKNNK